MDEMAGQIRDIDHRLTIAESKIDTIDKHLTTQGSTLKEIKSELHDIGLTIASGKGWILGILGVGAFLYTMLDWVIQLIK
jgi:hypothetical protein